MKIKLLFVILCLFLGLIHVRVYAQKIGQNNNFPISYDVLGFGISGYIQSQFQVAQSDGITSFSGGDFTQNSNNRFMLRRGRFKMDYVDKNAAFVIQVDATQSGVRLMDGFVQLRRPEIPGLNVTVGLLNRPFGYSIVYSSSARETPERARVFQTLMPRERDLGALLSYNPEKAKFLKLEAAMVNGSGLSAVDYDSRKDFIGNISFSFDSLAHTTHHLGFGASIYRGFVRSATDTYYRNASNGVGFVADTQEANKGSYVGRNYWGVHVQWSNHKKYWKPTLKAEYIQGTQPGLLSSASVKGPYASQSFSSQPSTDLYLRDFRGAFLWITQQVYKYPIHLVMGYDMYDPNRKISGYQIGKEGSNTSSGDVRYDTFGYGFTYHYTPNLRMTVYNEHVVNEKTQISGFDKDIKDDVFTLRLQYRW